jgi:hypothetical protein
MQNSTILKTTAALTTAATIAVGAMSAAIAAPVGTRAAQLEQATAGQVIDVQWRRWRRAAPWIAGGLVAGAIISSQRPYYGEYYYEDDVPPPGVYAVPPPGPGPRMCWIETGPNGATGYWAAC